MIIFARKSHSPTIDNFRKWKEKLLANNPELKKQMEEKAKKTPADFMKEEAE